MRRSRGAAGVIVVAVLYGLAAPAGAWDWSLVFETMAKAQQHMEPESLSWSEIKTRFDRICGKVPGAPDLTDAQLGALVEECEWLRGILERSGNPQAKVFLKRLKMCKDFFEYTLELRETSDE